jgi:Purple acid Phosphatase, N-terminal domain/Calcineurin-like phosphoesterase
VDDSAISLVGGGISRRGFIKGSIGFGAALGLSATGLGFWFDTGEAFADGPTVPIPSVGTAPEQVHLAVGADPATSMTVSWLSPGTAAQPAPSLVYSTAPISGANPGTPATVVSRSFTDQMNLQTGHAYHATLSGLSPTTTYYYVISDGASPASTFSGQLTTAPGDTSRVPWRFTSYGDLATPTAAHNPSATTWSLSSDNAVAAVAAIAALSPQPVVHLLNGDLCYANLNYNSQPSVWRDFFANVEQSAKSVPWMPCLGNHEIEWGTTAGVSGPYFNGANGYGTYLARFQLPDNGIPGLSGNFYSFQVGTVLFISLDADDVIYQDGGSFYAPSSPSTTPVSGSGTSSSPYVFPNLTPSTAGTGVSIPPGASTYNNQYTGSLVAGSDNDLVPGGSTPNQQTAWLAATLAAARANPTGNNLYPGKLPIDMIVVQMHQCAMSSSYSGNGSDLGIRQAWLPLFDRYGVDLVVSGHEHNYERTYAVRGYNPATAGTVVAPNPGQAAAGSPVFTRQPAVVASAQTTSGANPAFDTSQGTVYLVLGGGGTDGPTDVYYTDASGNPQAKVITQRNQIYATASGNWTKNPADSIEPAPWSARRDGPSFNGTGSAPAIANSWGYAVFDVDPGTAPGETVITMTYYDAPIASGGAAKYQGSTTYSPLETVVFSHGGLTPPAQTPEFGAPIVAGAAAAAIAGGAIYAASRRAGEPSASTD